ncbi:hypothetical protein WMY93_003844 [Mugilogobius chulae]|uniref:Uncharacterized protein n=1 Tax=Mugilogobius chulae TaxID=88201 RepID=A0AAW0PXD1_9GOBI
MRKTVDVFRTGVSEGRVVIEVVHSKNIQPSTQCPALGLFRVKESAPTSHQPCNGSVSEAPGAADPWAPALHHKPLRLLVCGWGRGSSGTGQHGAARSRSEGLGSVLEDRELWVASLKDCVKAASLLSWLVHIIASVQVKLPAPVYVCERDRVSGLHSSHCSLLTLYLH